MRYTTIDMQSYPRKSHFDYFNTMQNPYVGVTQQADVTKLYRHVKANGLPVFLSTLFVVTGAANGVPQLRQRIHNGGIIQYDWCRPSYTVAMPDETYCYCNVGTQTKDLGEFVAAVKREQELAMQQNTLGDGEDEDDLLFISCVPWLSYTGFVQPTPYPADSNPRISWGKLCEENGRVTLPLTLLAHHAIVDGLHLARFFEAFEDGVQAI